MNVGDYDPSLSEWIEVTREDGTTRRVEVVRRNARGQVEWMASSNTHRALWGSEKGRAVPSRD